MLLDVFFDYECSNLPPCDEDDFDPSIYDDPVDNGEDGGADDSDSSGGEIGDD